MHENYVSALAYQHAGPLLASGGEDGLLALWRPTRSKKPLALVDHAAGVTRLAWSPDDQGLAAGTEGGQVAVYAQPT